MASQEFTNRWTNSTYTSGYGNVYNNSSNWYIANYSDGNFKVVWFDEVEEEIITDEDIEI